MLTALLSYNRENIYTVNSNQGTRGKSNISDFVYSGAAILPKKENYNIIVVSNNNKIHDSLFGTLRHFSLNAKGINLFNAKTLAEAKKIAESHPEIVLVIIDENVTMNGSYSLFVDFVRKELKNHRCCITFKENLLQNDGQVLLQDRLPDNEMSSEFNYARARLIDITRMILLTYEMENKLSENNLEVQDIFPEKTQNEPVKGDIIKITSERFYSAIAHDLKEPVANIKVILDFLTNEPDLLDKKASKELLYRMRESANDVHEMLEDFLFWTRMLKQDIYFNPTKTDVAQIIRSNVLLLKSTALSRGISVVLDIPDEIYAFADEYMITTVFRNLFYNAIKMTGDNEEIEVGLQKDPDKITILVKDTFTGFATGLLKKLTENVDINSFKGMVKEAGPGLGLLICRDFIEKNSGQFELINLKNSKTAIKITLPAWQ